MRGAVSSALFLEACGVRAAVRGPEDVLEELRRDFEYFAAEAAGGADLELSLRRRAFEGRPAGLPLFRGPGFRVHQDGGRRLIRYDDGAAAVFDYGSGRGELFCADPARLRELAYLALLSRLGEALDLRGLHRVHALGFAWKGQGGLLLLPSGGGKSTLALKLLRRPEMSLLSEDTPLVEAAGELRAFPLRLGARADADLSGVPERWRRPFVRRRHGVKTVIDLPFFADKIQASAEPRWLLLGRRGPGPTRFSRAGAAEAAAALGLNLVAGWGVAQMTEYMLRPTPRGLLGLAGIAAARARVGIALLRRCELWRFDLGEDADAAARSLADFLG